MVQYSFSFILLHISTFLILFTAGLIVRIKHKVQIHFVFLSFIFMMTLWSAGLLLDTYSQALFGYNGKLFFFITHIGLFFAPVTLLFLGLIFAYTRVNFSIKHSLLLMVPIVSTFVLLTNDYHHLFYLKYSLNISEAVTGSYFIVHTVYSYVLILFGLYYLIYSSVKNSGFFSRQSVLILTGTLIPFMVNILATFKILPMTSYDTPMSFSLALVFYTLAILKYNFLNVVPIALQYVVDRISDSYVVINENMSVIDYNKTFTNTFGGLFSIKRKIDFMDLVNSNRMVAIYPNLFADSINNARLVKESTTFETHMKLSGFDKFFSVEVTPIVSRNSLIGTIILLKDITQSKKDLQSVKEKQTVIMQERLISMGQLIGGIAHNLKTAVLSISGGIVALNDLVEEYKDSIGDRSVTDDDHQEIVKEMTEWLDKMKPYCTYISDLITTVKGQAVQSNASSETGFTLKELIKRIDALMKHELRKNDCTFNTDFQVDMNIELKGDVNNLVQIFDNLIINAIHAYDGKPGNIDFSIKRCDDNVEFTLRDYGKGIPQDIADKLFKQMVTTKGKDGTGLGLYISYSNIKARFDGNMWFETKEGKGTTFYITIPYMSEFNYREDIQ